MTWYDPTSWFDGGEEFTVNQEDTWADDAKNRVTNPGTTHSYNDLDKANVDAAGLTFGSDQRDFMYGRDPAAADAAVNKAFGRGENAVGFGNYVLNKGEEAGMTGLQMRNGANGAAAMYNQRAGQQGDFRYQDLSLGQLGNLEAREGPSAAQAQLQQGTNQAMASQLALARSGSGFGGNAAAAGLAQNNMAGIQANQVNQAAQLRAQENAAWRGRQGQNLGTIAGMQGQQAQANLNAAVASRAQNDAMVQDQSRLGQDAYFRGLGAQMGSYGMTQHALDQDLAAQGLANNIRQSELQSGQNKEDWVLRQWAAKNGYELAGQQQQDQRNAGYISAGATLLATAASDIRGKTNIVPGEGAGTDYARGAGVDMIRDPWASSKAPSGQQNGYLPPEKLEELSQQQAPMQRSDWRRPSAEETAGVAPMTPMQREYMGGADRPGVLDRPNTRPVARDLDMGALDSAAGDAVRNSPASFYDYKDPSAPGADAQRHYGPMAQDLLKTPAGASAVTKLPDGKLGVDTGRLALVQHGAIQEQQQKIDELSAQLDAITKGQEQQGYDFKGYAR